MPDATQSKPTTPVDTPMTDQGQQMLTAYLAHNPHAQCPKCLYTLGSINADKCPECGLSLRLECGPIMQFSKLWLFCFANLAGALGYAVLFLAEQFTLQLVHDPYSRSFILLDIIVLPFEFWPISVGCMILAPSVVLFAKKRRSFDALPSHFRWLIATAICASGPILIAIVAFVIY